MKRALLLISIIFALVQGPLQSQSIYRKDNLFAWCIVPFDSVKRSPAERIAMLKRLGLSSYAYDWRTQHLATTATEWELAKKAGIEINAIWLWIDGNSDRPGKLSNDNERLLNIVEKTGLETQIWVGFNSNFFGAAGEDEKVKKGVEMLTYLHERAAGLSCRVAFYNHGDWIGEPFNQVKVIKASGYSDVGIIYNFHHSHDQLSRYEEIIDIALPYLWAVNLNGVRPEGPKILAIGSGNREQDMMTYLVKSGFSGRIGILGHIEEADVEQVLRANLAGMQEVLQKMGDTEAVDSYR